MFSYLSSSSILRPDPPAWLEPICQRLSSNDPTLQSVELPRGLQDTFTHEVARCLEENHIVTSLTISFFSIVDDGAYTIANALGNHLSIEKLQIRDLRNQREVNIFFEALSSNKRLREISLRHCSICPRAVRSFGLCLKNVPCLQEIRLTDTQFGGTAFGQLCYNLKFSETLARLYLVNNELQVTDMMSLKTLLCETKAPLEELHLSENNVNNDGLSILAEGLLKSHSLRVIELRSNSISELGAAFLQCVVVSNPNIDCLGLADNELGNAGVSALSRGLAHSFCGLKRLNLSGNGCDSNVARSVGSMLRYNKSLVDLNLSFNDIADNGASSIARALTRNSTLRRLEMRRAGLTCQGAREFGAHLPKMRGLRELILSRNNVLYDGGAAILNGLRGNVNLEYLLLEERMSQSIAREIAQFIRLNKAGRRAFRDGNRLDSALWPSIYSRFTDESDIVYFFVKEKPEVIVTENKEAMAVRATSC